MSIVQKLRRRFSRPKQIIEGYENPDLVETIFLKTVNYTPSGAWPLVANTDTVLDFGGGAGIHYRAARQQCPGIRWAVVETPAMVRRAKELATDRLMFFERIDQAADWLGSVDLVHSNGAIQYVPDPLATIEALCALQAPRMMWHRVPLSDAGPKRELQTSYLSDNGPGVLPVSEEKLVRYERQWLSGQAFIQAHLAYTLVERGPDPAERGTQQLRFERRAAVPSS